MYRAGFLLAVLRIALRANTVRIQICVRHIVAGGDTHCCRIACLLSVNSGSHLKNQHIVLKVYCHLEYTLINSFLIMSY